MWGHTVGSFLADFLLCFIPLFVAIDPLGMLPVFCSVTTGYDRARRRKLVLQAVPTALFIGAGFFVLGGPVLDFLNIALADLQIAGGAILFVFSLLDLIITGKPSVEEEDAVGIVPLATPLIVGPAVLTLGLVLVGKYGHVAPLAALLVNLAILAVVLLATDHIMRFIPLNTMKAISKVVMLLLAAIGVAFIREGLTSAIKAAS